MLVFNCGSSSQSFKVYESLGQDRLEVIASGKAKNVATLTQAASSLIWNIRGEAGQLFLEQPSHATVARRILALLADHHIQVHAVGHRFVHGGNHFHQTTRIDASCLERLRSCFPLAPIHNPNSYQVIEVCLQELAAIPEYVVFDTAFHALLPEEARRYAIPTSLASQYGFYKYGFHGLSYQYVSKRFADWLGQPLETLQLIICHLGTGGSSVAAVRDGHSIDTSMGYSPLPGLVMSTRCGDIDAEIVIELLRQGYTVDEVDHLLNDASGLQGLSGFSSNLEEIIDAMEKGNPDCQLAFDVYCHRLKLYLGAYTWLLRGAVNAILFTDDVGLRGWQVRERVCGGMESLGIVLDVEANRKAPIDCIVPIHRPDSRTHIVLVPTDEEGVIAAEIRECIEETL